MSRGVRMNKGRAVDPDSAMAFPVDNVATLQVREVVLADGLPTNCVLLHVAITGDLYTATHQRHLDQCRTIKAKTCASTPKVRRADKAKCDVTMIGLMISDFRKVARDDPTAFFQQAESISLGLR